MDTFIYEGQELPKYEYHEEGVLGEIVAIPTQEWTDYRNKIIIQNCVTQAGLPEHIATLGFEDYVSGTEALPRFLLNLKRYVREFDSRYLHEHLYLWSAENSTQKTTIAAIVGKQLAITGKKVKFVLMNELLKSLQQESFEEVDLSPYKEADFLIIDDAFDPKKITLYKSGYQLPFLDTFLRRRLEVERKATCFTSNLPITEVATGFGISIGKLLERTVGGVIEFPHSVHLKDDFDPTNIWD